MSIIKNMYCLFYFNFSKSLKENDDDNNTINILKCKKFKSFDATISSKKKENSYFERQTWINLIQNKIIILNRYNFVLNEIIY